MLAGLGHGVGRRRRAGRLSDFGQKAIRVAVTGGMVFRGIKAV